MAKGRNKKSESIVVLDESYALKPDAHQWQLCKATTVKGQTVWQPEKYGTLKYLVKVFINMKVRQSDFVNLAELSKNIEDIKWEMLDILERNGLDTYE